MAVESGVRQHEIGFGFVGGDNMNIRLLHFWEAMGYGCALVCALNKYSVVRCFAIYCDALRYFFSTTTLCQCTFLLLKNSIVF
jgi:hypothetical protein